MACGDTTHSFWYILAAATFNLVNRNAFYFWEPLPKRRLRNFNKVSIYLKLVCC